MPSLNAASRKPGLRRDNDTAICATTRHASTHAHTLDRVDMLVHSRWECNRPRGYYRNHRGPSGAGQLSYCPACSETLFQIPFIASRWLLKVPLECAWASSYRDPYGQLPIGSVLRKSAVVNAGWPPLEYFSRFHR